MELAYKLVTFGGGRTWESAALRLAREALKSGFFSGVESFNPDRIAAEMPSFFELHRDFMDQNPRGYGYWIWKPEIVRTVLASLSDAEDGVVYLDAGCTLNSTNSLSRNRWKDYESMAQSSNGLFFQLNGDNTHTKYTKNRTIEDMNAHHRLEENLIAATAFFLTNTPSSSELLRDWSEAMMRDSYSLLIDPKPQEPQNSDFLSHRHDQSILSLLIDSAAFRVIKDETFFSPNWSFSGSSFPIWATRNKSRMPFVSESLPMRVLRFLEQRVLP